VGALDSWVGQNVVQWCLGGSYVGQISPVEVHHAQKPTELAGSLWRLAVLEMGHSFIQRLGTLGRHLVTEESDLGCPKDILRRVADDPIPLKLVKEYLLVFVLFK
jgi:hypothetical protein